MRCVKEIFLVLIQQSRNETKKECKGERGTYGRNKNTTFHHSLQTHTPLISYCKTTRTRQKRAEKRGAMILPMMTRTAPTTTPSDDVPPLFLRCF